ncbi:DUF418 domain-containing protein [Virgibacillus pantothenticus]|uniref:DUF418 domain-containing protein n=1 Tax=Virgibacillus pantothenticus TaxID=1473 RepID=UPI0025B08503|nr:DUF418 domain-containing protein [Virgibacillus pantothenticus]
MSQQASPVQEKDRLHWIDAARGFAIFGILIVNILSFSSPYFHYGGENTVWNTAVDETTLAVIDIVFQASFYSLFSFLFGFGLQLMNDRLQLRNIEVVPLLTRRLLFLLLFGVIHAFGIWYGDILITYALVGLLALLYLKVKDRTLIYWAIGLLGGFVGFFTFISYLLSGVTDMHEQEPLVPVQSIIANYQSKSILAIWSQNAQDWMFGNGLGLFILPFMLLPLFLIGMYVGRKRWLHKPAEHQPVLKQLWWVSLILFLLFKLGPYGFGNPLWFELAQDGIGGLFSALFYICSITLLAQTETGAKMIRPFIFVGRMAFTNYIMQSIICVFLFYGIGLGWYGHITPLQGVGIAIIIYGLQMVYSSWWLRKFRYGPLEWLWRSLTYKQKQRMRKETA